MRIAYIYTALTTVGGVDRILTVKANYMADNLKYEVYIITDSQVGRPPVFPLSPQIKHIDLETNFDEQYHCSNIVSRFFCYHRLMRQYKQRLSNLLMELQCDVVCTTCGRDMDFLTHIKDGSIKIGESHIAKAFMRNFHLMKQRGFPYNLVAKYWEQKQHTAIKRLDAFVVLTQHDAQSWRNVRKAIVIPNPNTLSPQQTANLHSHTIISVGRLDEQKGYDRLIEAWTMIASRHQGWQIKIFGNGLLHDELQRTIIKHNLTNSMTICPPTQNIMEEYLQSSFYVMSSRFEGFGLVLAEAMSCGLPCISFDCPYGPAEIIQDGKDGFLVSDGDIKTFAEKMELLIDNFELRSELGAQAKTNIQRYNLETIMQQWHNLFHSLTTNK